ncbi:MmgE/PrpD family protein [Nocardioides sp. NPDC023903]|uniref:MmgE/PrpD family protein n=1 Tax=Nocardioides sp. NPDC023903 TaxID=3157195 RepID=UPI0033C224DC
MISHTVRTRLSSEKLPREEQLAWKLAAMAIDPVAVPADVVDMAVDRVIDNAACAAGALARRPVVAARDQALRHPAAPGAMVFGASEQTRVSAEWAAWANAVAVRELDLHDTVHAVDNGHPADNIPALLAVAQHCHLSGADLVRGIAAAYEVQVDLCKSIGLHQHKIDQIAHLGPSAAAGIGAMLDLDNETVYHAIGQALHCTTTTWQARTGQISTWKAFAPGFAGKVAIEAIDCAMRGMTSPTPIYEGQNAVIAWMLDGPDATYSVSLPGPGEPKRAIMETYPKEYSAEFLIQPLIDLARHAGQRVSDSGRIEKVVLHVNSDAHNFVGSGSGDPHKWDPNASRETLDHSLAYIFAVALQDQGLHHIRSYERSRATRPDTVALWQKVSTLEDPELTRLYHEPDPAKRQFGGRAEITMADGSVLVEEIAVADAHPAGARPFGRDEYVAKFAELADGAIADDVQQRFLSLVSRLPDLTPDEVAAIALPGIAQASEPAQTKGIL